MSEQTLAEAVEAAARFREHSVLLNALSWRIAVAVGDVPDGATSVEGDPDEQLTRLVAQRDSAVERLAAHDAEVARAAAGKAWWEGVNDQWKHRPIGHRLTENANPYRADDDEEAE